MLIGLMFASLFDSFSTAKVEFDEILKFYPDTILDTFNITNSYLSTVENFVSGQFYTLYLLIGSVFAFYMGVGEIGGKIDDKTIGQWLTKTMSRSNLFTNQFLTNFIALSITNISINLLLYIQLIIFTNQESISQKYFFAITISTLIFFFSWASIGQLVGIFMEKSKAQGLGAGIIIISWFINTLSSIGGFPDWLNKLSIFTLFDIVNIRDNFEINWLHILTLICISLLSLLIGIYYFQKKISTYSIIKYANSVYIRTNTKRRYKIYPP
ncbi:MAG: ABC transporter permease subunit [Thermales bacterium]|nr:ABC transporter permease subunit [Thermales bacterium]